MYIYTVAMTIGLTWMILIIPNSYSAASNALDWLMTMTLFVFAPLLASSMKHYHAKLEKRRKAASSHARKNTALRTKTTAVSRG